MTEEKKTEKVTLEREYNVPLRKAFTKVPAYKKANKAMLGLKEFIKKHMKATDIKSVKVSKSINEKIWEKGIKNPPHHVKVKATKYETYVAVELAGVSPVAPKKEEKKPAAKKEEKKAEVKPKATEEKKEAKAEVKTDAKKEIPKEAKVEAKEEAKPKAEEKKEAAKAKEE